MKPQPIFAKNSTLQAGHRDLTGLLSSATLRVCSHLGQDSKSLVDDASANEAEPKKPRLHHLDWLRSVMVFFVVFSGI